MIALLVPLEVEIQENWVRPGYTPLFILIAMAVVMTLLFISMRRQFKRIQAPYAADVAEDERRGRDGDSTDADH